MLVDFFLIIFEENNFSCYFLLLTKFRCLTDLDIGLYVYSWKYIVIICFPVYAALS